MKRSRFYHRWAMKLFFAACDPLLRERPDLVPQLRKSINQWLDCHEKRK